MITLISIEFDFWHLLYILSGLVKKCTITQNNKIFLSQNKLRWSYDQRSRYVLTNSNIVDENNSSTPKILNKFGASKSLILYFSLLLPVKF